MFDQSALSRPRDDEDTDTWLSRLTIATEQVTAEREPSEVLQAIAEAAHSQFGAWYVVLLMTSSDGVLQIAHIRGIDDDIDTFRMPRANGDTAHVMSTGKSKFIGDLSVEPEADPRMYDHGVRAAACLPLKVGGQVVGVLWAHYAKIRHFSEEAKRALTLFAGHAALAYDDACRARELAYVIKAADVLLTNTDEAAALSQLTSTTRQLFEADYVFLYPYDAASDQFLLDQAKCAGIDIITMRQAQRAGIGRRVLEQGVCIEPDLDLASAEIRHEIDLAFLKQLDVRAFCGIRLAVNDEPVGVLFLDYRRPRRLTVREQEALTQFAQHASVALRQVRLQDRYKTALKAMQAVAKATASDDLEHVLDVAVQSGRRAMLCDVATVYAWDPERGKFIGQAIESLLPHAHSGHNPDPDAAVTWMMQSCVDDVHIAASPEDMLLTGTFASTFRLQSCIAVRMMDAHSCLGVIFFNHRRHHSYSGEEIAIAREFAHQVATSISNYLLRTQKERQGTYLAAEREGVRVAAAGDLELQKIAHRMCELALQATMLDASSSAFSHVGLLDQERRLRFLAASRDDVYNDLSYTERFGIDLNQEDKRKLGIAGRAVLTGKVINASNLDGHPDYITLRGTTRSQVSVPLRYRGDVIGVISVEDSEAGLFTDADVEALRSLGASFAVAAVNLGNYEQVNEAKKEKEATLRALAKINEVSATGQLPDVLFAIVEQAYFIWHFDRATAYAVEFQPEERGRRRFLAKASYPTNTDPAAPEPVLPTGSVLRRLLRQTNPAYIVDGPMLNTRHAQRHSLKSAVGLPLRMDGKIVGILNFGFKVMRPWSPNELDDMTRFATIVAAILHEHRVRQRSNQQLQVMQVLQRAAREMSRHASRQETISRILDSARDVVQARINKGVCFSHLAIKKGDWLDIYASLPSLQGQARRIHLRGADKVGITGRVALSGQPRASGDVTSDDDYLSYSEQVTGIRSQLSVPVFSADTERVMAVLSVEHSEGDAFDEQDIDNLQLLATQAAISLANADLNEHLSAVQSVAQASVSGQFDKVIRAIAEEARNQLNCDMAILYAFDDEAKRFVAVECDGKISGHPQAPEKISSKSPVWEVFDAQEGHLIAHQDAADDVDSGWALGRFASHEGIQSTLAVPLRCKDMNGHERRAGVLFLSYLSKYLFSEGDVKRAKSLAQIAGISILNLNQFERMRKLERSRSAGLALAGMALLTNAWMHSFYNSLHGLNFSIEAIDGYLAQASPNLGEIQNTTRAVKRTIQSLRTSIPRPSRAGSGEWATLRLSDWLPKQAKRITDNTKYASVKITTAMEDDEGCVVQADEALLEQAIHLLLENAAKSVVGLDPARKRIGVSAKATKDEVAIVIVDSGAGIPVNILSQINVGKPAQHISALGGASALPNTKPNAMIGLGFGLILVRFVAEMHNGDVEFENLASAGTRVTLRLPRRADVSL